MQGKIFLSVLFVVSFYISVSQCAGPCATYFVLSKAQVSSNFGGVAGGDAICSAEYGAGYLAFLSNDTLNAADRLPTNTSFVLGGAEVVAVNRADLLDGSSLPYRLSERYSTGQFLVWTGSSATGNSTGFNCNNWTNNTVGTGSVGVENADSFNLGGLTTSCASTGYLYCISPPVELARLSCEADYCTTYGIRRIVDRFPPYTYYPPNPGYP